MNNKLLIQSCLELLHDRHLIATPPAKLLKQILETQLVAVAPNRQILIVTMSPDPLPYRFVILLNPQNAAPIDSVILEFPVESCHDPVTVIYTRRV